MKNNEIQDKEAANSCPIDPEHKTSIELDEAAQLTDPEKQAEYRREYLAQLRRRACPGCGESEEVF